MVSTNSVLSWRRQRVSRKVDGLLPRSSEQKMPADRSDWFQSILGIYWNWNPGCSHGGGTLWGGSLWGTTHYTPLIPKQPDVIPYNCSDCPSIVEWWRLSQHSDATPRAEKHKLRRKRAKTSWSFVGCWKEGAKLRKGWKSFVVPSEWI